MITHASLTVLRTGRNQTQVGLADQTCIALMDSDMYRTYDQGIPRFRGQGATVDDAIAMAKGTATPDSPVRGSHCMKARP